MIPVSYTHLETEEPAETVDQTETFSQEADERKIKKQSTNAEEQTDSSAQTSSDGMAELGAISMDNGCAAVAFPDFTRGEWNVTKGYKHAYASPEDENASMEKAKAFTAKLKEQGAKEWAKEAKKKKK